MKILVIVESPGKCKLIASYLNALKRGHSYTVLACNGHIRDLKKTELGIDIDRGFVPEYVLLSDKEKVLTALQDAIQKSDKIYLATDQDREGESIAWHLQEAFKLKHSERIRFNEITRSAIEEAVAHPSQIDMDLVNAQQTRRILDRLMGFKMTPLLWKRFTTGSALKLSAGRVQSAAMKLIMDREKEIESHESQSYWLLHAKFKIDAFLLEDAKLVSDNTLYKITSKATVLKLLSGLRDAWHVGSAATRTLRESPPAPFSTSSLQQEASAKLGLGVKQTMMLAQALYEAGHITYMRTDSHALSDTVRKQIQKEVGVHYGPDLYEPRQFATKAKGAQEAHEAIRPTHMDVAELGAKKQGKLAAEHARLYELIWKRTMASQMKVAEYEELEVTIQDASFVRKRPPPLFRGKMKQLVSPGYLTVYGAQPPAAAAMAKWASLQKVMQSAKSVKCLEIVAKNTWSAPPARYTEASLVKLLEKEGIGRPSTYVSILGKLFDKQYVLKQNVQGKEVKTVDVVWEKGKIEEKPDTVQVHGELGKLVPTTTGKEIDAFLREHFLDLVDARFTKEMEDALDDIAEGSVPMKAVLQNFWKSFEKHMTAFEKKSPPSKQKGKTKLEQPKQTIVLDDGTSYQIRMGPYGPLIEQLGAEKKFWGLKKYLQLTKKAFTDITPEDVSNVLRFPLTVGKNTEVLLGRFGPYLKQGEETFMIPKPMHKLDTLMHLSAEDVQSIVKRKRDYEKKKQAASASPSPAPRSPSAAARGTRKGRRGVPGG